MGSPGRACRIPCRRLRGPFSAGFRALLPVLGAGAVLLVTGACGVTDPLSEDLLVSGTVTDLAGVGIAGATVSLWRESCLQGACSTRTRGEDVTDANGEFRIVVVRDADERELWELVCHEFALDVEVAGYDPIEGDYQGWRAAFCASGEVSGLEFALAPSG